MFERQYTDDDIRIMRKMWKEGSTATEIGYRLRKSQYSVRQFMHRNRKKYGFEKKAKGRPFLKCSFDKAWHGVIPCGHWMITKPWR